MQLLTPFVCWFVIGQSYVFFCSLLFHIWDHLRIMCSLSRHELAWAKTPPWYKATSDTEVSRCTEFTVHVRYPVGCDINMQDLLFKILQEKKLCAPVLLKSVTLTIDFREWLLKTLWLWDKCNAYVFLFQNLLHSVNNILSTFISLFCKIHT